MEDKIGESLGLSPIQGEIVNAQEVSKTPVRIESAGDQQETDYQYARDNFYNVIEKGTQALEDMLNVAKASEHPRAYEVVSTLMKTLVDANKDLVSMGEKKKKDEEPKAPDGTPVTNNNLFVGSTAELQQILKDMRNNDD